MKKNYYLKWQFLLLSLLFLNITNSNAQSWAQVLKEGGIPDRFTISSYEINTNGNEYVEFKIPFFEYDINSNTSYNGKYVHMRTLYLEYSRDGGLNWETLIAMETESRGGSLKDNNLCWIDIKDKFYSNTQWFSKARTSEGGAVGNQRITGSTRLYYTAEVLNGESRVAYVNLTWKYGNLGQYNNQVLKFRVTGTREGEGVVQNHTWNLGYRVTNYVYLDNLAYIAYGNPQHTPEITGFSLNNDGTLKVDFKVNNYNYLDIGNYQEFGYEKHAGAFYLGSAKSNSNIPNHIKNQIASPISKSTSAQATYTGSFTTKKKLTAAQLNDGDNFRVTSWRRDFYSVNTFDLNNVNYPGLFKESSNYAMPIYPLPYDLLVDIKEGDYTQLKLNWSMKSASTVLRDGDGFVIQWKRSSSGDSEWKDFSLTTAQAQSIKYDKNKTSYELIVDIPEMGEDYEGNYDFRIKRAGLNFWEKGYYAEKTHKLAVHDIKLKTVSASNINNKAVVSWTTSAGIVGQHWFYKLYAINVLTTAERVASSKIPISAKSFTDTSIVSCTKTRYRLELWKAENGSDVGKLIRSMETESPIVVNSGIRGEVEKLSVSKGYYNDRVNITWRMSSNANYNYYTIGRREQSNPNAVEQEIYQVENTRSLYSYEDRDAIPGTYYEYYINCYYNCDGDISKSKVVSSIGFSQPFGIVSGRIAFEGSQPVEGVSVIAEGNAAYKNKSIDFTSSQKSYVEIPYKENMLTPNSFSFQAWIKPKEFKTDRSLLTAWGKYNIFFNSSNQLCFEYFYNDKQTKNPREQLKMSVIDSSKFVHITIVYEAKNDIVIKTYLNGQLADSLNRKLPSEGIGFTKEANISSSYITPYNNIYIGKGGAMDYFFGGYMDELRMWNKALSSEEIKNNYDRYLFGNEDGLVLYYRFDEKDGREIFDLSCPNNIYNEYHGTLMGANNVMRSEINVPTRTQLSIKDVTDANGHYLINTIPYTGTGSSYTITPVLGVHQFNPTNKPMFFNSNSSTYSNVDFTDVSSFEISGKVYYEGGDFPVEACNFEVDGKIAIDSTGKPVATDPKGFYKLKVPIGQHSLRVVKTGHNFVDDGYALENGKDINFNDDVTGLNFKDLTKVKLIGHIVGGTVEHKKTSGFGERKNNIGSDKLTLKATKEAYYFLSGNTTFEEYTQHNNGEWTKDTEIKQDSSKTHISGNEINITVSPVTGEYVAWVYPEKYYIQPITVEGYGKILKDKVLLDLSNVAVSDESMMPTSIRTWIDSVHVSASSNHLEYWAKEEKNDTVKFHKEWGFYYQAEPEYTITQMKEKSLVNYFGDEVIVLTNPYMETSETVTIIEELETATPKYVFDHPVFSQGKEYTFFLKAFEKYVNNKTNETDIVNIKSGDISFSNNLVSSKVETLKLDSLGEATYKFVAGLPDLTTGIKYSSSTVNISNTSYIGYFGENKELTAYLLGSVSTGTDFMTAGPDNITAVVHDPPGSLSYAWIEKGTTVTKKTEFSAFGGLSLEIGSEIDLGTKITTFVGLGAGVITDTEVILETDINLKTEKNYKYNTEEEEVSTFSERFETSSDPIYVGHDSDVFIGNSTNIQYGLTNAITIQKVENLSEDDILYQPEGSDYAISKSQGIAFGQVFKTRFAFTELEIEKTMIPKWRNAIKNQFAKVNEEDVDPSVITAPVYISRLPEDDSRFGKRNGDEVFGDLATTSDKFDNGESYVIIYPDGYHESEAGKHFTDSIIFYNNQITIWQQTLADNEKEKLEMQQLGNYSFGSGASVTFEHSKSATKTKSHNFSVVLSPSMGLKTGTEICGIEMVITASETTTIGSDKTKTEGSEESTTVGFKLQEEGHIDEISVDYGITESGTLAFKSRGGRTSCPHEDEFKTKYYKPGTVLSEASMQIEVPKIDVKGNSYAVKVPANRPAAFTLELKNESETGEESWFTLMVDEKSNPLGASLQIDGSAIGNGRNYIVKSGEVLEKTLTIVKGPNADKYDTLKILLTSQCQYDPTNYIKDIYDFVQLTVEFIPTCSEVVISAPSDRWLVNTETGAEMEIVLEGYDVNYSNFEYIDIQYRPSSSAQWTTITKFYADKELFDNASEPKEQIAPEDLNIRYLWEMEHVTDGEYEFRARSICNSSEYITTSLTGIKDMTTPLVFGTPKPENGILSAGDNIMIQFNEEINQAMLTTSNFSITGVKNGTVDNHFTSVHFDGISGAIETEQEISLANKPFTIEFWLKRDQLGRSVIFNHGNANENITIGFTDDNKLQVKIGNSINTSNDAITNTTEWGHYAIVYDTTGYNLSAYYAAGNVSKTLINSAQTEAYTTAGIIKLGTDFNNNYALAGNIHSLRLWDNALTLSKININMNKRLSGNEIGLIGLWTMYEGKGNVVQDKASNRHATMNAEWKILPEGKALLLSGNNSYMSINTASSAVIINDQDFTVEMWFKGENQNAAIFSCGRGDNVNEEHDVSSSLSIFFEDGKMYMGSNGNLYTLSTTNYLDNQWHHVAVSVDRTNSANVYIDGNLITFIDAAGIGGLAAVDMTIAARKWYSNPQTERKDMHFKGLVDEFRIWNSALTQNYISEYYNVRLKGNEAGLVAYYPFDRYITNNNDQKELEFTLVEQIDTILTGTAPRTATVQGAVSSDQMAPIKDAGPVSDYAFTIISSSDKIILELTDSESAIERTLVSISAQNIQDKYGNKMNSPKNWIAYIDRSVLKWDNDYIKLNKPHETLLSFTNKIINNGGNIEYFTIENIPTWLTVSPSSGSVPSAGSLEVTFTVNEGINVGTYNEILYLKGTHTVPLKFDLIVGGEKPDWTVNPSDYMANMSIYGILKINEIISKDESDLVAAFANNQCVGVASPKYDSKFDMWLVFMTIYGNTNDTPLEFRVWDASTGKMYADVSPTDKIFSSNAIYGTPYEPIIFSTSNLNIQNISLKSGWNWISFNLNSNALGNVNTALKTMLASENDEIKGQISGSFSRYNSENNLWSNGTLNNEGIQNEQMYMVKSTTTNTISISGEDLDPTQVNINLNNGWNWIGYIPQVNMTVEEALSGLNPAHNDVIKSQTNFAIYDQNVGWMGSLKYLKPNSGYMYKSTGTNSFKYPRNSAGLGKKSEIVEKLLITDNSLIACEHNFSLVAEVSEEINVYENSTLVAAINGEIRGIAEPIAIPGTNKYIFFITIAGKENNGNVHFSLISGTNETTFNETINYSKNGIAGTLENPVLLTISGENDKINVYPNPFTNELTLKFSALASEKGQIEIYNILGSCVFSTQIDFSYDGEQIINLSGYEIGDLNSGVYTVRVIINDEVKACKVVKN